MKGTDLPQGLADAGIAGGYRGNDKIGMILQQVKKVLAHHSGGPQDSDADLFQGLSCEKSFSMKIQKRDEKNKEGMGQEAPEIRAHRE
jgi:hypothetical protein